jgi:hypothetical protein
MLIGPAGTVVATASAWRNGTTERQLRAELLRKIPPDASVLTSKSFLSHVAMREELYSVHYVLKGLKTLSRERYQPPPPPQRVLLDYSDAATFDAGAGFYHPAMRTAQGETVPSSDRLLHELLRQAHWRAETRNSLVLLERIDPSAAIAAAEPAPGPALLQLGEHTELRAIRTSSARLRRAETLALELEWVFRGDRAVIPWMVLRVTPRAGGESHLLTKGLCAPEVSTGAHREQWQLDVPRKLLSGTYDMEALFVDQPQLAWELAQGGTPAASTLLGRVPLGALEISDE